jgi:hypothetical protein
MEWWWDDDKGHWSMWGYTNIPRFHEDKMQRFKHGLYRRALLLVCAGRRDRRVRLPPELWNLIFTEYISAIVEKQQKYAFNTYRGDLL